MALVRMTDNTLAASRANVRKSNGPTTPEGKDKVSRDACKHHLYSRKFLLLDEWATRIWAQVGPLVAAVENPAERTYLTQYLVLKLWGLELFSLEARLINKSIARNRSIHCGIHAYALNNPLAFAIQSRSQIVHRKAETARAA